MWGDAQVSGASTYSPSPEKEGDHVPELCLSGGGGCFLVGGHAAVVHDAGVHEGTACGEELRIGRRGCSQAVRLGVNADCQW